MKCQTANSRRNPSLWQQLVMLVLSAAVSACWLNRSAEAESWPDSFTADVMELEVESKFSQIVVSKQGNVRSLIFIDSNGQEAVETELDLDMPHRLLLPYTRYMFGSYLFRPKPQQVLIVGLGGGSMIHFLKHYDPDLRVDVVEIDPVVVKIADLWFGVRSGGKLRILVQDAFKYLTNTRHRYDVIYMDAFLKPSAETDISGVPLRLTTVKFLKSVQKRLKPGGLVVFNVHLYDDTKETLAAIRNAFPQVYVFEVSHRLSLVVVGSLAKDRERVGDLRLRAKQLDQRFRTTFSFGELLKDLRQ